MTSKPMERETTRASLELLYHISRELTNALDMRTVLERVLFESMRAVNATRGTIIVLDDQGKPAESAIIAGDQIMQHTTQRLRATLDSGLAGWVARNRKAALVTDSSQDERWMLRQYDIDERTEPISAVSAPLLVHDRLIGIMTLVHPKAGFFNSDHVALVQAIADQAGIAVLNARLYAESQRQARVMTVLAETAAAINASLDLEEVLPRILEQIRQSLSVQAVSLLTLQAPEDHLSVRAAIGWANSDIGRYPIPQGRGIASWVAREGRGLMVSDLVGDPRYDPEVSLRSGLQIQAIACAPLRYRGEVIGVLEAINPTEDHFDSDALLVLTGIGDLAGTTVRHAQLFERLQAAHQSYRELFEDSIDPILITDWEGNIVEANRKAVLASDFDKDSLCNLKVGQLHVVDAELTGENFRNLSASRTITYESRLRTRSGHEVPIQVYVRPVQIEETSHIQWIMRDITERKKLDSMREDLMSMIYHDLRSPLGNILSSLEMLDSMLPAEDDDNLHALLAIAKRSVERIQHLTNALLDVNRLEAGQPVGARQAISPITLIRESVETQSQMFDSKEQKLEILTDTALPLVDVDPEMIKRVLTNLIENASKFSPPGSHIQVSAEAQKDQVLFWVKDDGIGIPATEHQRIFEKFTRLQPKQGATGLGLGLAYCRLAVEGHGGHIWVESEPGKGSRFNFTLPTVDI